jgi:hypothetical protein
MATSDDAVKLPPGWTPVGWEFRINDTRLTVRRRWRHFYNADSKLVVDWEITKRSAHGYDSIVSDDFDSRGDLLTDLDLAKRRAIAALVIAHKLK